MRRQQETKEQPVKKKTRRQRNQRRTSATESGTAGSRHTLYHLESAEAQKIYKFKSYRYLGVFALLNKYVQFISLSF